MNLHLSFFPETTTLQTTEIIKQNNKGHNKFDQVFAN